MVEGGKPTIGFVGTGAMGAPMCRNLLKAGYRLVVTDARREAASALEKAGAVWAATPSEMVYAVDVAITCLPTLEAIEAVVLGESGFLSAARPGLVLIEMSTNSLALARKLHAACTERGVGMLEAPVSGGAEGAKQGSLAIWVGGDKALFERHEGILRVMGSETRYVGNFGAGLVTKLAHNCTVGALTVVMAEVFAMAAKAGADPLQLWAAVRQGALGRRRTFDGLAAHFLTGTFEPSSSPLRIVYKDMVLATELAREMGAPLRLANLALADFQEAMLRGWSERDYRSVAALHQERLDVSIAADPSAVACILEGDE